jgi:hypothetical protein
MSEREREESIVPPRSKRAGTHARQLKYRSSRMPLRSFLVWSLRSNSSATSLRMGWKDEGDETVSDAEGKAEEG